MKGRAFSDLVSERFLSGFTWAVGCEFVDAVRCCSFNEGDVLYSDRSAYDSWSGLGAAAPMVQVFRTDTRSTASFEDNWNRQVWIEVWVPEGKSRRMDCPAGCLFHVLQTGDVAYLDQAALGLPPAGNGTELRHALKKLDGSGEVFALPFDLVVQESIWKVRRIGREFGQDPEVTTPAQLGARISVRPTVHIAMLDVSAMSEEEIVEQLRRGVNPHAGKVALGRHGVRL